MKYLIMETHPGYCVALDEKGAFFRIANFGYETGDVVYDVVMMKDAAKSSGSRRIKKMYAIAAVAACFAFALIPAMSLLSQEEAEVQLSINPSVTMTVDEDNKVDDIEAGNEDGQDLLENYSGEGKNVNKVIGELVARAADMGFLLEGETVNIDVGAEDGRRANSLSEDIGRYLKENLDGKYSLVITSNGMELINRHVILYEEETTTTAPPEDAGGGADSSPASGGSYINDYSGDSGYGSSDYGGSSGGAASPVSPTSPPAADSGYGSGDSGYDGNSNYSGDSGYGDSVYD